jgi:hypothetical protein
MRIWIVPLSPLNEPATRVAGFVFSTVLKTASPYLMMSLPFTYKREIRLVYLKE